MMKKDKHQLFKQIFSDAKIIDIDLSQWDKSISIYVVADHVESQVYDRLPVFVVEFSHVKNLNIDFNHYDIKLAEEEHHYQWNVDDFSIKKKGKDLVFTLFSGPVMPRFEICCKNIDVRSVDVNTLDEIFPGWNDPYKGFVRPCVEEYEPVRRNRKLD